MPVNISQRVRPVFQLNRHGFTLTIHDRDAGGSTPASGLAVTIHLLDASGKPGEVLVKGLTDRKGQLVFSITEPGALQVATTTQPLPQIHVTVSDVDGDAIGSPLVLQPERGKPLPIQQLSIKAHIDKLVAPLDGLKASMGLQLSAGLDQALKDRKIASLAQLRSAQDIASTAGLGQTELKELKLLQGHARLQLISRDHKINQQLLDAGFPDVTAIAALSRQAFTKQLSGRLPTKTVDTLHRKALKATAAANRLAFVERVDRANNRSGTSQASTAEPQPCACDCQSAVSPTAYLAALLDYTARHVRLNGAELSLSQLDGLFLQPFAELPDDCTAAETQLRQVRLCIEVLRRKAAKDGIDVSPIIAAHAQASYASLLSALGVSNTELRLARTASPERQQQLADRLAVPLLQLFSGFMLAETDQTEEKLQTVFGLPSTNPAASPLVESTLQQARLAALEQSWLAVDQASERLLLDPDLISSDVFAVISSRAEELLEARRSQLDALVSAVAAITNEASLTSVMTSPTTTVVQGMHGLQLGSASELDSFNQQRQAGLPYSRSINGEPVALNFATLGVRKPEFDQLLIIRQLAVDGTVTTEDWNEATQVLTAIEKRKALVPIWRAEEQTNNISLTPEVFNLLDEGVGVLRDLQTQSPAFLRWRVELGDLRDWLSLLKDRIAQRDAALAGIQSAVDAAEDAHLAALRDRLVDAVITTSPPSLDRKKRWVSNHLLISANESACRKTTRTAQSIEALQLLLWGIHSKLFERPEFTLDAPEFEAEWKGLGTYASWRALQWVFIYPENVARPSLIARENRTLVLAVYELIINYWPLLGLDPEATSPDSNVDWYEWAVAQEIAWRLRERLFTDESHASMNHNWINSLMQQLWDVRLLVFSEAAGDIRPRASASLEAFYYVPIDIAFRLRDAGRPEESLKVLRRVSDLKTGRPRTAEAADALDVLRTNNLTLPRDDDWLLSPLPHEAAERIPGGYERRVVLGAISAYLDMAEADFARDTGESLARAREAYLAAMDLLESDVLGTPSPTCRSLTIEIGDDQLRRIVIRLRDELFRRDPIVAFDRDRLITADLEVDKLVKQHRPGDDLNTFGQQVHQIYGKAQLRRARQTMQRRTTQSSSVQTQRSRAMLANSAYFDLIQRGFTRDGDGSLVWTDWIPAPAFTYCIPPNPVITLLRLRAESGFFKLTHCMNSNGLKREPAPYSAPTDVESGVSDELVIPVQAAGMDVFTPPGAVIYRFKVLIEQARQLVAIAQQVEASYLSFLDRLDQETYSRLRARQDLGVASATVNLQDLRVDEALRGKDLALQQSDRVLISVNHYADLLSDDGELWQESLAFWLLAGAAVIQSTGAIVGLVGGGIAVGATSAGGGAPFGSALGALGGAIVSGGGGLATASSALSLSASYERRKQEWKFQQDLSTIDKIIAETQQLLAEDRYQITLQERRISQLSRDNANDVVEFLDNKFTSRELYAWMGSIVSQAYRYFLQQATGMAKLAQRQLAFERQEPELGYILDDYLTYAQPGGRPSGGPEKDRRGLTGSVRLLQDITRLDQRAFLTDRRRIPLPKHISLFAHDPIAFLRFRETGILPINTTMDQFDRDFPGDYLRLVKRIRVSVVALIPPLDGIKATLSSTGISRVVRGGDRYQEATLATQPETVTITAPSQGPGLMELQQDQAEMYLPFEGLGVAGGWVFSLPKAANAFDFNTIADVIFTIEYSAIYSDEYRRQVVQRLNSSLAYQGERTFSLRQHFADEWYSLHHPELIDDVSLRLRPTLELGRADYPPNLINDSLKLSQLSVYVVRREGITDEINISGLSWVYPGGTSLLPFSNSASITTRNGLLTTRDLPASSAFAALRDQPPLGTLSFQLAGQIDGKPFEEAMRQGLITDIQVAVAIRADLPPWPEM
ncbi:hypothetical protein NZK32_17275 [Cyanobium sp. FGCU-52]|nr:hypothetical protein [Cyanobium sp. FGCU52]